MPAGYDLALTTRPYYRSTYALVYVAGRQARRRERRGARSICRAATRDALRIGVFTPGPAAEWLARRGLYDQMVPYSALDGDPDVYPGKIIENELLAGELDAAILWGPIAGYFAARAAPVQVAVVPLRSEPGIQFEFAMAAGVRFGERERRAELEDLMARTAAETAALFAEYHIPVVEGPAERVYVTNEDAGTVSIISTATHSVIGEVDVGTRPRGVEVSGDGERLYVALSGSPKCPPTLPDDECAKLAADKTKDGIAVVDVRRARCCACCRAARIPKSSTSTPRAGRLFVSNEDAGELSIVDLASGEVVRTVAVGGEPEGVRLRPDRKTVYVTSESDHAVTVVDAQSGAVLGSIDVGWRPRDAIFSADGSRAYVSAEHGGSVAIVDVATSEVLRTVSAAARLAADGARAFARRRRLYVANGRAGRSPSSTLRRGAVIAERSRRRSPVGHRAHVRRQILVHGQRPVERRVGHRHGIPERRRHDSRRQTPWGIAIGPPPREP